MLHKKPRDPPNYRQFHRQPRLEATIQLQCQCFFQDAIPIPSVKTCKTIARPYDHLVLLLYGTILRLRDHCFFLSIQEKDEIKT